jgi:Protein of unknown function, DUF547
VPDAEGAWRRVLARHVDESGRIDFEAVAKSSADLDAYVAWIAAVDPETSPGTFPTPDSRKAYYLNAYNALAMYNVIASGIPESLGPIKFRFFFRDRMVMGGKRVSLYRLENSIVRPLGDPRIHFALNCMVRGCPRLPRVPFEAARLDGQLDEAAKLFFSEERNVRRDDSTRTVFFNEILRFYKKDFLKEAKSLVAYANLYRSSPIPEDYRVRFTPYDWTVNRP